MQHGRELCIGEAMLHQEVHLVKITLDDTPTSPQRQLKEIIMGTTRLDPTERMSINTVCSRLEGELLKSIYILIIFAWRYAYNLIEKFNWEILQIYTCTYSIKWLMVCSWTFYFQITSYWKPQLVLSNICLKLFWRLLTININFPFLTRRQTIKK